jgi:hypothetical protein
MIEATNVVPFPKRKPHYEFVTVAVETNSPLEEGDLVAWQFINKDGSHSRVLFDYWRVRMAIDIGEGPAVRV